jgi:hypothetical protein
MLHLVERERREIHQELVAAVAAGASTLIQDQAEQEQLV